MSVCVVMGGLGKVGCAIANVLREKNEVFIHDKLNDVNHVPERIDFLHVCIAWSDLFMRDVFDEWVRFGKPMTIIHSTVPVGTTKNLGRSFVHSPVRGQHDDLREAVKRFIKYVGGNDDRVIFEVCKHMIDSGFSVEISESSDTTELMKLLCLSRFLNDLAFYETADKLCEEFKVNKHSFLEWTKTYNNGYRDSGMERPELKFPNGHAGGSCALPVPKMLYEQTNNSFLKRNIEMFEDANITT